MYKGRKVMLCILREFDIPSLVTLLTKIKRTFTMEKEKLLIGDKMRVCVTLLWHPLIMW